MSKKKKAKADCKWEKKIVCVKAILWQYAWQTQKKNKNKNKNKNKVYKPNSVQKTKIHTHKTDNIF